MISTFTTSIIALENSTTLAGLLAMISILLLIGLLILKELAVSAEGSSAQKQRWMQVLNIAIGPLMIVFFLIVTSKIIEFLH
jgi:hypothetical protein